MLSTVAGHYLLGFPSGHIVSGATHEPDAGFDHRVTAAGLAYLLEQTLQVTPGLATASVRETRVGFRPAGPAGTPVVGRVPGFTNLALATGMGSVGLTLGPFLAQLAADLTLGDPAGSMVTPLAPVTREANTGHPSSGHPSSGHPIGL